MIGLLYQHFCTIICTGCTIFDVLFCAFCTFYTFREFCIITLKFRERRQKDLEAFTVKDRKEAVYKIARELDISVSTVYNVINSSASVSDKKRKAVAELARSMGFDLSDLRILGSEGSLKVVAAIPSVPSSFWDNAILGINDSMKKHDLSGIDFRFIRYSSLRNVGETMRIYDIVCKMSPDACILVPSSSPEVKEKLESMLSSFVTAIIDEPVSVPSLFFSATADYATEGMKAAEIISDLPLEKKNILLVCIENYAATRKDSFFEACKNHSNLSVTASIPIGDYYKLLPSELSQKIASLDCSFNCVYSPDGLLGPVCTALRKLKLNSDVYVVGHDASPATRNLFLQENGFKGAIIYQDIYHEALYASDAVLDYLLFGRRPKHNIIRTGCSSELFF